MKNKPYNHLKIEKKWQKDWLKNDIYKTEEVSTKKKMYVLDMFPYPSGAGLHVGHPRGYIGSDVYARMKRMEGYNVLHPMGYDAFGLPAEQYALEHKIHPRQAVKKNIATFEKQLSIIGLSYDWSRRINTTDPQYYKWTQWIFLKLFESWYDKAKQKARPIKELIDVFLLEGNKTIHAACDSTVPLFSPQDWKAFDSKQQQDILMKYRIAYEGYSEVNWCPGLGTVLANDEILDGPNGTLVSERGGFPVEQKLMRQWFMRITAYAERLLADLETLDWSEHIKEIQKNWIGKSEGLIFTAPVKGLQLSLETFSAHFEACFADTFVVIAPDHPLLEKLTNGIGNQKEIINFAKELRQNQIAGDKELKGIFTGRYIVDPLGNGDLPIWVANYVLANYGTGIVKCSAHDERDFAFAKKYNIPLKIVLVPQDRELQEKVKKFEICFSDMKHGILLEPKEFEHRIAGDVREKIADYLIERGLAQKKSSYKMRDAIFARQRYWGEPIPLVHNENGITPLLEEKLPLVLPPVKSYGSTNTAESPLASIPHWQKAGYETNTMPGWAGSAWYFLRYMDPNDEHAFVSKKALQYWKNVDIYVGGQEHATGHLLYARFWHKFLYDLGYVETIEPFQSLRNQGSVIASDGRKMSKRWGNIINPDDIVKTYGADTLRVYEMFMGPFDQSLPWSTENIIGSRRFIERVWRIAQRILTYEPSLRKGIKTDESVVRALQRAIKKVSEDIEHFNFNTAVSAMMICITEFEHAQTINIEDFKTFLKIFAPFAPHVSEELWTALEGERSIHQAPWPAYNKNLIEEDFISIAVQVNGKTRAVISVPQASTEEDIRMRALEEQSIARYVTKETIEKVIYIPKRLINFVLIH